MHIVVIFDNVGGYHAARLRAVHAECQRRGWRMTAIQVTDRAHEHPWGDLEREITFPLKTLVPAMIAPLPNKGADKSAVPTLLRRCLDDLQPDVVAIPGWGFPVSRAALSWSRRHRALTILMSESKWDDEKRVWWKERVKSWLYVRKFDAALVGGELHRDYLVKLGFPRERISLGYDVVDNNFFREHAEAARHNPFAARLRQPKIPQRNFFLAVTRLIERKNVVRLVESYTAYRRQIGEAEAWDMVVCGSGEQEEIVRRLLSEKNLANSVHLPGFVPYQAMGDWYGLAGAFVHPALQEQWGLVVNEACAAGLPIMGSHTVGACHETVQDKQNGLLFDPHSTEEITQAMLEMHRLDESTRNRMGQCSQKLVARFAPEEFANGLFCGISVASSQAELPIEDLRARTADLPSANLGVRTAD